MRDAYVSQVKLLVSVLPYISQESSFALKGGTAINLFIRDLPRLSVDIDLQYVGFEPRVEALKNINSSLKRISDKLNKIGKLYNLSFMIFYCDISLRTSCHRASTLAMN